MEEEEKEKKEEGTHLIRTLHETALYPHHVPRKPTALYNRNHHRLVVTEDRPCRICGVRNSTLKDPEHNKWGATAIETHHSIIEDSLANAIDLVKFNKRIRINLLHKTKDTAKYGHEFTQEEMLEWIHGDEHNLWILCSTHHRSPLVSIHTITYPIFSVQDLLFDGYDLTGFHVATLEEAKDLENLPSVTGTPEVEKD